jgi:hypothetical protein
MLRLNISVKTFRESVHRSSYVIINAWRLGSYVELAECGKQVYSTDDNLKEGNIFKRCTDLVSVDTLSSTGRLSPSTRLTKSRLGEAGFVDIASWYII